MMVDGSSVIFAYCNYVGSHRASASLPRASFLYKKGVVDILNKAALLTLEPEFHD